LAPITVGRAERRSGGVLLYSMAATRRAEFVCNVVTLSDTLTIFIPSLIFFRLRLAVAVERDKKIKKMNRKDRIVVNFVPNKVALMKHAKPYR
jgi:hypothetical protein